MSHLLDNRGRPCRPGGRERERERGGGGGGGGQAEGEKKINRDNPRFINTCT